MLGESTVKRCKKCKQYRFISDFPKKPGSDRFYTDVQSMCKSCFGKRTAKYISNRYKKDGRYRLWLSSHSNSWSNGIVHTIKVKDIPKPDVCIYLGCLLDWSFTESRKWNNPSIDRIDPTGGYVPGNIQVLSDLANRMKQNATVEQLLAFARGIIRQHGTASEV